MKQIDISSIIKNNYLDSYIVLFDPTIQYVKKIHKSCKNIFIFIFITSDNIEQVLKINWNKLPKSNYIVMPWYLGNIENKFKVAQNIINNCLNEGNLC